MTGFTPQATLLKGWGYWDTTDYPYGGCFRRTTKDTPVIVLDKPGPKRHELFIEFTDGRTGACQTRALARQLPRESTKVQKSLH